MKKHHIHTLAFLSIPTVVLLMMAMPTSESRAISRAENIIEQAQEDFAKANEDYTVASEDLEAYSAQADEAFWEMMEANHVKMCAQCRAMHARYIKCHYIPEACQSAHASAQTIIEEWYGEIEFICYTEESNHPPCLTQQDYLQVRDLL